MLRERWTDGRGRSWRVQVPQSRRERRRGLLAATGLDDDEAMAFPRCRSIHTFGMGFRIDAVALDADLRVVAVRTLPPRRVLLPRRRARHMLEAPAGSGFRPGDRLHRRDPATTDTRSR